MADVKSSSPSPTTGVVVAEGPASAHKAQAVVDAFPQIWSGSVLDVGSRTRELQTALPAGVRYVALDIDGDADVQADIGEHIPLADGEFDVVVALDVLEHADNIHRAFEEVARVASHHLVISLPNAFVIEARLRYLRGRHVSGKYGLPVSPPADRHRWLFGFEEAVSFLTAQSTSYGWRIASIQSLIGPGRARMRLLVERWPDVWAPTVLAHLTRA